jgi:hypothetical protein
MPIVRTYQCGDCFHRIEVTLTAEQWDDPPPPCPACATRPMQQEFTPPHIGGSTRARAVKLAETIAAEDYGVADMNIEGKEGVPNKVRYKDINPATQLTSGWGKVPGMPGGKTITVDSALMATAMAAGKQTRAQGGDGLDILQQALKSGAQPDLIEQSKKHMMRVYDR